MKTLLFFTFLTTQFPQADSLLQQLHAYLDKSLYEQAFPIVNQLGTAEIQQERPMIYAEAQYLLALSYWELGVRNLSNHTLDRLIAFLHEWENIPESNLLIARCYQLKADIDRDILDLSSLKENAEKLHHYYKQYDPEEPLYDALYYAYISYNYCYQGAFEDGFHFAAKAYDIFVKHKERASLIDDYVIYASFCLAARNWWDGEQYGAADNKLKFADTLKSILNKRFPGKNMRRALRVKDYANMTLDLVFNFFDRKKIDLNNVDFQSAFDKLLDSYDEAIEVIDELSKGKGHDYISRYHLLKLWLYYGKRDHINMLDEVEKANQAYPVADFLEDGFVTNTKQIEDIHFFKILALGKQYANAEDSFQSKEIEKSLLLFEKLWETKVMERIHSPEVFFTYMYNNNPYQEIFQYYLEKYEQTKDFLFLENAHQYAEKNRYNSFLFSQQLMNEKKNCTEELLGLHQEIAVCLDSMYFFNFLGEEEEVIRMRKQITAKVKNCKIREVKCDLFNHTTIPTIGQIQGDLQTNQARIVYTLSGTFSVDIFITKLIITKDSVYILHRKYPGDFSVIMDKLNQLNTAMANANLEEYKCWAILFYHYLMEDVEKVLPAHIEKLEILPLPFLSTLPMEILLSDYSSSKNFKDLPFLVKKYSFNYLLSSTIDAMHAKRKKAYQLNQMAIFSPASFAESALTSLGYSEKQAVALADSYGGRLYQQSTADKRHFFEALKDYKVVTLISHGRSTDFIEGVNAGVFLHDGYVDMNEIYDLQTNTEFLILNTCESGEGIKDLGEGNINLVRAFSFAGIPSIMASSWELDERSSLQILSDFFENLQAGKEKSAALRDAKLSFLENSPPRLSNPYYWGSMRIIGDDTNIQPGEGGMLSWWWVLSGMLCAAVLSYWGFRILREVWIK